MKINDPLSQSELARKLNLPTPRLASLLREHGIEPSIRRQNLALYSSETLDTIRNILEAESNGVAHVRALTAAVKNNVPEFIA